jgi:hypothetical protein
VRAVRDTAAVDEIARGETAGSSVTQSDAGRDAREAEVTP